MVEERKFAKSIFNKFPILIFNYFFFVETKTNWNKEHFKLKLNWQI